MIHLSSGTIDNTKTDGDTRLFNEDRILYCDENVAAALKLAGEVCETGGLSGENGDERDNRSREISLPSIIEPDVKKRLGHTIERIEAAHRLDRSVTGVVVCALSLQALSFLNAAFAEGSAIRKTYWAIVEGVVLPTDSFAELKGVLRFDPRRAKASVIQDSGILSAAPSDAAAVPRGKGWKPVRLLWRSLGAGERYSFIEVVPLTGRTHQIRAQLAAAGLRIKGDLKYGARRSDPLGGIRLHARRITFPLPGSDSAVSNRVTVTAPIPVVDPLWQAFLDASGEPNAQGISHGAP